MNRSQAATAHPSNGDITNTITTESISFPTKGPPPWYQLKVRDDAEKLRDDIEFLLVHSDEDGDCPAGPDDCTVTDCKILKWIE